MEILKEKKLLELNKLDLYVLYTLRKILMTSVDKSREVINNSSLFYSYLEYDLDSFLNIISSGSYEIDNYLLPILTNRQLLEKYLNILVMQGIVTRHDNLSGPNTYRYVSNDLQNSAYTKNYVEISGNNPEKLLLISDTHIGSSYQDFELINRVFEYAIVNHSISCSIHLGDLFEGVRLDKGKYSDYELSDPVITDILYDQLEQFKSFFPDNLKVIAVEGNHDLNILNFLNKHYVFYGINENYLSLLKSNFHMVRRREYGYPVNIGKFKLHLNHELQFNMLFTYVKTDEIGNFEDFKVPFLKYNTNDVDLYLSGHFHSSMKYCLEDDNGITRRRYEVIPSLSKINYNNCVAKIIRFIYDASGNVTHYGIIPLYATDEKNIFEGKEEIYESNYERIRSRRLSKR